MNIKKVDDKPMVIYTKEKVKIHSHEPHTATIKGSNVYTVDKSPKIKGADTMEREKKSYRKSTVHQTKVVREGRRSGSMCECGFCGTNLTRRSHHQDTQHKKPVWKCLDFLQRILMMYWNR